MTHLTPLPDPEDDARNPISVRYDPHRGAPHPDESRAEDYDAGIEHGATSYDGSTATSWRLHNDVPEPRDPWTTCRCGEPIPPDTGCVHGRDLGPCCAHRCPDCEDEKADARADFDAKYEQENRRG